MKQKDWATLWKMSFNPEPTKQAQEVIFSNFNKTNVKQTGFQKHLGLILDSQLSFEKHLKKFYLTK